MEFNSVPIMQMMAKKLSWLSHRTEVIALNVSNANTPGYKARDLKPVNFRELVDREAGLNGMATRVTNARHISATGTTTTVEFDTQLQPDAFGTGIDGNDVSLEQQLTRLGQNQLSYRATTNLYRKHLEMFRIALGR